MRGGADRTVSPGPSCRIPLAHEASRGPDAAAAIGYRRRIVAEIQEELRRIRQTSSPRGVPPCWDQAYSAPGRCRVLRKGYRNRVCNRASIPICGCCARRTRCRGGRRVPRSSSSFCRRLLQNLGCYRSRPLITGCTPKKASRPQRKARLLRNTGRSRHDTAFCLRPGVPATSLSCGPRGAASGYRAHARRRPLRFGTNSQEHQKRKLTPDAFPRVHRPVSETPSRSTDLVMPQRIRSSTRFAAGTSAW